MMLCRLCGYESRLTGTPDPCCPICGLEYAANGHEDRQALQPQRQHVPSPPLQRISPPCDVLSSATASPEALDPELGALLRLLPKKNDKKKREEDILRAASVLPANGTNTENDKPEAVYILPRADPIMQALKARHDTNTNKDGAQLHRPRDIFT